MTQDDKFDRAMKALGNDMDEAVEMDNSLLSTEGFMREPVGAAVDRINAMQDELRQRLRNQRMVALHLHDEKRADARREYEYAVNEAVTRLERDRDQRYRQIDDAYFAEIKEIEAAEARLP